MRGFVAMIGLGASTILAGCGTSTSTTVTGLPPDVAKNARITAIEIGSVPNYLSPEFKDTLSAALQSALSDCAKGTQPLRVSADILDFKRQQPLTTYMIGDSDEVTGQIRFIDPMTNQTVGEYTIYHTFSAAGLLGMAVLANAESMMANDFAEDVCARAFG